MHYSYKFFCFSSLFLLSSCNFNQIVMNSYDKENYSISADASVPTLLNQKISNLTNRTFELENISYNDAVKYKIGGFYIPKYNSLTSYYKRIVYRAGIRFEETGINLNGQDINEFGISFGVGIPVGRLFSNVNIGFEIGKRGTTDFGLIQENFFNTFISLSFNDRWFDKRYLD